MLRKRNIPAVITLFLVSPLVAEYLLGDLPLKLLGVLIVMAPVYGSAAVLVRETARRVGRGWPTMLMLGAAFTLVAEGLVTQSLFNPDYLKKHWHLLHSAYLPALGIGGWWTLFMFNLHTFWSMGVSIALAEALYPAEAESPWLGWVGDLVVGVVFVLGLAADFAIGWKQNQFMATPAQLVCTAVLSAVLMACAFLIPARRWRSAGGRTASPWITGGVAFAGGMGVLFLPAAWGWGAVGAMLALDAVFLFTVVLLSRQTGWGARHVLGLGAGGALAYGIHAFTAQPLIGGVLGMRISNAVFLAAAIGVIWLGARRVRSYQAVE